MKFTSIVGIPSRLMSNAATALVLSGAIASGLASAAWAQEAGAMVQSPRVIDEIVAVVNNEIITAQELLARADVVALRLRQQQAALPPAGVLRRQVLEQMIMERVQLQRARERGIRVEDAVLDRSIAQIAAQNNLNVQELRDQVEREGVSFVRFREDLRNEILGQRLREREVSERVRISEAEIDQYLAQHAAAAQGKGTELNLLQILVRVPENASPEQVVQLQNKAEQARQQLLSGADFAQVAAQYSDLASSSEDTNLGWRTLDRLPQLFVDGIAQAEQGEVSPLIRSGNGFHVLKLQGKRQAGSDAIPAVQQTRARHILIKVNQVVSAEEARRRLIDLKQRLDNNAASFEELAKRNSNDLSASAGGDLGWIYPGDTVPEFERAMNALKPGEISQPVESPFGYHLIQVLERRTDDVSPERLRMAARNALYERKMQEQAEEWMRELRDRAYVEYRLGGDRE
jgi:peptidyl-prolyl cis-trans isomerase SurA